MQLQIYYLKECKTTRKTPGSSVSSSWQDCPTASRSRLAIRNGRAPSALGTHPSPNCGTGFCTTSSEAPGAICHCTAFSASIATSRHIKYLVCISATEIMVPINIRAFERDKGEKNKLQSLLLKVVCAESAQPLSDVHYESWPLFSESAVFYFKLNFFVPFIWFPSHPFGCEVGLCWPLDGNFFLCQLVSFEGVVPNFSQEIGGYLKFWSTGMFLWARYGVEIQSEGILYYSIWFSVPALLCS